MNRSNRLPTMSSYRVGKNLHQERLYTIWPDQKWVWGYNHQSGSLKPETRS